jgi:hypothetical protein
VTSFSLAVPAANLALAQDPLGAGSSAIGVSTGSRVCGVFYTYCEYREVHVSVSTAAGGFSLGRLDDHPPDASLALPLLPPSGTTSFNVSLADGSVFSASLTSLTLVDPTGDYDADGVPTATDNCPYAANPLQEDADGDQIGNACDRFPNAVDNQTAQCLSDLGTANAARDQAQYELDRERSTLSSCLAQRFFADADSDAEDDATDHCPSTPSRESVDQDGCSKSQFGAARAQTCKRNDWLNDEPGVKKPNDCVLDKKARTCS